MRERKSRNVTMREIAEKAGVSIATVSRAIRSPHLVRVGTRQRIEKLISDNSYVYHAAAADLRKKSTVIGLIVPTSRSTVFTETIQTIQEESYEQGFSVMISNSQYSDEMEAKLLQQFEERRLAGIILTGFSVGRKDRIKELVKRGMPCLIIWEKLDDDLISYVGFDNFKASFTMTEYVISLNHRRIGFICGPFSKVGRVRARLDGHRDALKAHAIPFDPALVVEKEPTLVDGREAMRRLLSIPDRPTAVIAASDILAIGALAGARDHGMRVPEDVSLAGFDDIDFAAYCDPPLTTIRVPSRGIGQLAVKTLIEMMKDGPLPARQYCLDTDLVIRSSCSSLK